MIEQLNSYSPQRTAAARQATASTSNSNPFAFLRQAADKALGGLTVPTLGQQPVRSKEEIQAGLNAFRDSNNLAFRLPPEQPGEAPRTVKVRPQFQMEGGLNDPEGKSTPKGRAVTVANVGAALPPEVLNQPGMRAAISASGMGRGTPEQIQRVTQALIDAGKLPPKSEETPGDRSRVRRMMWDYGLGTDCAGYTAQAAAAGAGRDLGLKGVNRNGDSLMESLTQENFTRVAQKPGEAMNARAGDIIRLKDVNPDEAGHWVSVFDHTKMSAQRVERLYDNSQPFWQGSQKDSQVHVYTVDSSWGAGGDWAARSDQNEVGGVDRRKWLYNAANDKWGTLDDSVNPPTIRLSEPGPYNHHRDVKVFRPK